MARALRVEFKSAFYHVISRGQGRKDIFNSSTDRTRFLELVEEAVEKFQIRVYAYCLMGNHYHLLIETLDSNLSNAMKFINGSYATYFNAKWKRIGHVFASRYKAILVEKDSYLMELSRYIHLNPVRAKIVDKPEKFKWSSYKVYIGQRKTDWVSANWLLKIFGSDIATASQRYQGFVEKGIHLKMKDPLKEIIGGMILGKKTFVDYIKSKIGADKWRSDQIPEIRQLKEYPTLEEIEKVVKDHSKLSFKEKRKISIYLSYRLSNKPLKEIGTYFGGIKPTTINMLVRRMENKQDDKIVQLENLLKNNFSNELSTKSEL